MPLNDSTIQVLEGLFATPVLAEADDGSVVPVGPTPTLPTTAAALNTVGPATAGASLGTLIALGIFGWLILK